MVKKYLFFTCLVCFHAFSQVSGVGINTENPQQALHLAGSTGTIRIDGLNSPNNNFNGGGVNKTFPLFVDSNGDLTLAIATFQNSDGSDAITASTPFVSTSIAVPTILVAPNNGVRSATILPYTITLTRPAVLEIKYSLSYEILLNATTKLKSDRARRVSTYYTVNGGTRRYGQASKCYFNNNTVIVGDPVINCAQGVLFNSSTTYINLTAGTHTINFIGEVNTGTSNDPTLVNFAIGTDSVFMRIY